MDNALVGGVTPSEKYESQLGWSFPIYGKIKNVPNHQSATVSCLSNLMLDMSWYSSKEDETSSLKTPRRHLCLFMATSFTPSFYPWTNHGCVRAVWHKAALPRGPRRTPGSQENSCGFFRGLISGKMPRHAPIIGIWQYLAMRFPRSSIFRAI